MQIVRPINTKGSDPIITTGFDPVNHPGVDYAYDEGTPWYFAADGKVIFAKDNETRKWIANQPGDPFLIPGKIRPLYNEDYGNYVIVQHDDGYTTLYAHSKPFSFRFKVGDVVKKGQMAGQVGSTGNSTGNHQHFEVRQNGVKVQPGSIMDTAFTGYFEDSLPVPQPPATEDRRGYWFDLINRATFKKPHEKLTDAEVKQFAEVDYPSREKRAATLDKALRAVGYQGDTTNITPEQLIEIIRGSANNCAVPVQEAKEAMKVNVINYVKTL